MKYLALALFLVSVPAAAAYDIKGVVLGASEKDVVRALPSAHCKALEWESRAADRRCDDSRVSFVGVEVKVTFYLKKDAVEAFDLRFDTKEVERFVAFLKTRYGAPKSETRDEIKREGKATRKVHKVLWEDGAARAVLVAQLEKGRASMLVSRGTFDEEIYKVR
ncbi:MAG TPA: hypothetical protein VJQ58_07305 [Burkholderiales bacterium]|nr:hypothetical protein [Burkholderiales bacterium]